MSNNNSQPKVFLIARVSDPEQRKALPAQKMRLLDYAKKKNWKYTYYEYDESAYKEDRKKFSLLVEEICKEESATVAVFDKIDRFSRDASQHEVRIIQKQVAKGILELHFPFDNLTITKDSGANDLFRLGIGMLLAKYYSDASRDNVKRRFGQMLRDGMWPHRAPVGYNNVNLGTKEKPIKEILVDDSRSHYIVMAFELRAQGMPYSMIAKELVRAGFTSSKTGNNKLNKGDVERIICGPNSKFYYGIMTHDGKEYKHKYPPIINRALYNQCQLVKDERKSMKTKWNSMDFTLGKIVSCGKCGRAVSPFRVKQWVYLTCANPTCENPNTAESLVLGSVEAILQKITLPEDIVDKVIKELKAKHDDQQLYYSQSIMTLRGEYDSIDKRLETFFDQLANERLTPEQYEKLVTRLTERQEQINEQLNILTSGNKDFLITQSYLLDLASRADELFNLADEGQRSKLLGFLLSNLKLNDKKLSFDVNYPFDMVIEAKEKSLDGSKTKIWCG